MIADTVSIGWVLDIQLVEDEQSNTTDKRNLRRIDNRQIGVWHGHVRTKITTFLCRVHTLFGYFSWVYPGYTWGIPGVFPGVSHVVFQRQIFQIPGVTLGFFSFKVDPGEINVPREHFCFNFRLRGLFVLRLIKAFISIQKEKYANKWNLSIWQKCTQIWQLFEKNQGAP